MYRYVAFAGIEFEQMKMGCVQLAGKHIQRIQLISNLCQRKSLIR